MAHVSQRSGGVLDATSPEQVAGMCKSMLSVCTDMTTHHRGDTVWHLGRDEAITGKSIDYTR